MTPGAVAAPASTSPSGVPTGGARASRGGGADAFGAFLAGATDAHADTTGRREAAAPSRPAPTSPDQHGHTPSRKPASTTVRSSEKSADSAGDALTTTVAADTSPADALVAAVPATAGAAASAAVTAPDALVAAAAAAGGVPAGGATEAPVPTASTASAAAPAVVAAAAAAMVAPAAGSQRGVVAPASSQTEATSQAGSIGPTVAAEAGGPVLNAVPASPATTAPATAQAPNRLPPSQPLAPAMPATDPSAPSVTSAPAAASTAAADSLPLGATQRGSRVTAQDTPVAPTAPPTGAVEPSATSRPVVAAGPAAEPQNRAGATADPLPGVTAPAAAAPAPLTAASSVAPAAPAAASAPQTLDAQLARPVFTLAAAGRGEHVMTVHVTPDNLGPVTVRAHVGAEGVRVELFAPTDAGRDALRAILPDLRRDLGSSGLTGTLDLSSQNQPSPQQQAAADGRASGQHGEGRAASDGLPSGDDRSATRGDADRGVDRSLHPAADGAAHSIDLIV